jgi:hypothetical protein
VFSKRAIGIDLKNSMNGGDRNGNIAGGDASQKRAAPNKKKPEITRRQIKGQTQIAERRNFMGGTRVCVICSRDGEIRGENLVSEGGAGELRWVGERKGGERGFDEVRVDVFRLIAVFQDKVLEEGVCG